VTGGLAWGTVQNNLAVTNPSGGVVDGLAPASILPAIFGGGGSFSHTQTGWTIGGGVESRIWGAWSLKLEYLYVDLGSMTDSFGLVVNPRFIATNPASLSGLAAGVTSSTHFTDNIVRVGLNYKWP
jgi:outer membrane immunogenic protein